MSRTESALEAAGEAPRLQIGAWPLRLITNTYNTELYRHLADIAAVTGMEADRSSLRAARRGEIDILHVHWLDRVFWVGGRLGSLKRMALMYAIARTVRRRGGRVVWTAHDPTPHEMKGTRLLAHPLLAAGWRLFEAGMIRLFDGVLVLSPSHEATLRSAHPALADRPFAVTPHPHYRGVYPDTVTRQEAREALGLSDDAKVLLFLGSIRPYKGVLELLRAFREVPDPEARLLLAGKLDGDEFFNREVERAAEQDARVCAQFGFVPDDRLQLYCRSADAAALPFTNATNSGSAMLALSYDLPIIVPETPIFRDLRDRVGAPWVMLVKLPIEAASLAAALNRNGEQSRQDRPNLAGLNWSDIARATAAFFASLR